MKKSSLAIIRIGCLVIIAVILSGLSSVTAAQSPTFESELISVKTQGSGPDLILFHGFASSPEIWSEVVEKLKSKFRLHVIHVAGFSGMPAPKIPPESYLQATRDDIIRYIEHERIKKPTLIGHSMGGLLSLIVASSKKADLERLIIVDALPFFSLIFDPEATSELVAPRATAMEKQLVSFNDAQFEFQAKSSIAALTKHEAKRALLLKWTKQSDRKAYSQILREVVTYDARPELKDITCPVTVIYAYDVTMGMSEEQITQRNEDAYAGTANVHLEKVTGSYHFIMWDQPKHFLRILGETLADKKGVGRNKGPEGRNGR